MNRFASFAVIAAVSAAVFSLPARTGATVNGFTHTPGSACALQQNNSLTFIWIVAGSHAEVAGGRQVNCPATTMNAQVHGVNADRALIRVNDSSGTAAMTARFCRQFTAGKDCGTLQPTSVPGTGQSTLNAPAPTSQGFADDSLLIEVNAPDNVQGTKLFWYIFQDCTGETNCPAS